MYHVKMAFTLIQVGTNMWVNPIQIQGLSNSRDCPAVILLAEPAGKWCSDWPLDKVRAALSPAAVAKAMEPK